MKIKDYAITRKEYEVSYIKEWACYKTEFNDWENLPTYYESDQYVSHHDNTHGLFFKLYAILKKINLNIKWKSISSHLPKKKLSVLDYGCGTGEFLKYLQNKGHDSYGVEINDKAKETALRKNLKIYSHISDIQNNNKKFDIITLWHVLEHVPDFENLIIQLKGLLTENGIICLAVPNYESYDAKFYKNFWAAWDVPRHIWHFSKKSFTLLSEKHALKLISINNMYLDAYFIALLSEKYKNNSFPWWKAFYVGTLSNLKGNTSKNTSSLLYIFKN